MVLCCWKDVRKYKDIGYIDNPIDPGNSMSCRPCLTSCTAWIGLIFGAIWALLKWNSSFRNVAVEGLQFDGGFWCNCSCFYTHWGNLGQIHEFVTGKPGWLTKFCVADPDGAVCFFREQLSPHTDTSCQLPDANIWPVNLCFALTIFVSLNAA